MFFPEVHGDTVRPTSVDFKLRAISIGDRCDIMRAPLVDLAKSSCESINIGLDKVNVLAAWLSVNCNGVEVAVAVRHVNKEDA